MANDNRYVVDDSGLSNAGFSNQSHYDIERNKILSEMAKYSPKSITNGLIRNPYVVLILLTIFPIAGLHRMTNGKILSGILFALTLGGFFIWMIIDWVTILSGKFTDRNGLPINAMAMYKLENQLDQLEKRHARGEL